MAFERTQLPFITDGYFTTYRTVSSTDPVNESLLLSVPLLLHQIRVHLSTNCSSNTYVRCGVSLISGSEYQYELFSTQMSGLKDYIWHPSGIGQLYLDIGDELVVFMQMSSVNVCGITLQGWSIVT